MNIRVLDYIPLKLLLFILFLVYIVLQELVNSPFIGFGFAALLVIGYFVDFYLRYRAEKLKPVIPAVSLPPHETYIFRELGIIMKDNQLEMRIRGTEHGWNVTFLTSGEGVHRMVGKGSATTISEALAKAEEDFEYKKAH